MRRNSIVLALILFGLVACVAPSPPPNPGAGPQGWSESDRQAFYTTSQGSQMMPYSWFRALRRLDKDEPFSADQLERYGYLANPVSVQNPEGLPVGFTIDRRGNTPHIGMTCAACHTAQIDYRGTSLRVDGGRTNADFQTFLSELTIVAQATRDTPARFDAFARSVLGPEHTPNRVAALRKAFTAWTNSFGDFMAASLPPDPWGPGRLDAFGMIFNRVAGLDLNIPQNRRPADAPVRYPFLWDAPKQDKTQWNGAAPNGLFTLGLIRNTGEVFGVFAQFNPHRRPGLPGLRYSNSADFQGLQRLEETLGRLLPPIWPKELFGFDAALARRGEAVYQANCANQCHAPAASNRIPNSWATALQDVGTDPRMAANARLTGRTGVMQGTTPSPLLLKPLPAVAPKAGILANAVFGAVLQQARDDLLPLDRFLASGVWRAVRLDFADLSDEADGARTLAGRQGLVSRVERRLAEIYSAPRDNPPGAAYEARVLRGVWAVAPYLHNGSVANLWELLQPAARRQTSFMVGSREFDPKQVGFATDRSPFNARFTVNPTNGNSNAGHEYGAGLSDADKWALIEYLKSL